MSNLPEDLGQYFDARFTTVLRHISSSNVFQGEKDDDFDFDVSRTFNICAKSISSVKKSPFGRLTSLLYTSSASVLH